jgi:alkylhydroperoxidase/carboxymuconolactone decarboxylase family protein YurZ
MSKDLARELTTLREKRGYLLPHHGLMAVSMPALLNAYDALYSEIALNERVLSRREHEFVWLAILIACEEAIGTHHIERYRVAGGTDAELEDILALTTMTLGIQAGLFVEEHWLGHLPDFSPRDTYIKAFEAAAGDSPTALAHLAGAAVSTCKGNWAGLRWHLVGAYQSRADEHALAEALSLTLFPGGVPNFVEAADVWRKLIVSGDVNASEDFRTWANMSGQSGFDEAAGTAT